MIMKRILYILPFVLLASVSCKEDTLDVYNGDNYIHFTPSAADVPQTEFNFAYDGKTTRETECKVPVEIRLWGYLPTRDFKCKLSVVKDKTSAASSSFSLPSETTFRAGHHVDTLWLTVKRNEQLLKTNFTVTVKLEEAEDAHIIGPSKYNTVTVKVTDKILAEPVWWATKLSEIGKYTDMKYRVFNYYIGKVVMNIDNYTSITFKEEAVAFRKWWKAEWEKGNHIYYDSDGKTPLYETIPE